MYAFGSEETRMLIMPGLANVDITMKKSFRFGERVSLEYRAEFFNLFNHTNFSQPGATLGTPPSASSPPPVLPASGRWV